MEIIGKQKLPHQHFGLCIFPLNAAHVKGAGCFVVYVGHASKVKSKKGKGKSGKAKGKSSEFKFHPSTPLRMTIGIKLQNTNPADLNGYRKYAKKKKIATPAGVVFLLAKQYVYKNVMALPSVVIYFGSGIFPLNAAHIKRAGCFVVYVGHASKVKSKKAKGKRQRRQK